MLLVSLLVGFLVIFAWRLAKAAMWKALLYAALTVQLVLRLIAFICRIPLASAR